MDEADASSYTNASHKDNRGAANRMLGALRVWSSFMAVWSIGRKWKSQEALRARSRRPKVVASDIRFRTSRASASSAFQVALAVIEHLPSLSAFVGRRVLRLGGLGRSADSSYLRLPSSTYYGEIAVRANFSLDTTWEAVPCVSVIIPVYNDPRGIEACLAGLERQTWPTSRFEVIVIDNRSEPPLQVLKKYAYALHVGYCEKPGSYSARNVGAAGAIGQVLAFTDADCVPDADWLRNGVAALESHEGRAVVGGDVVVHEPSPRTAVGLYQFISGFQQKQNIEKGGFSVTANLFCYKSQFLQVGPFNESLLSGGDREWSWRARTSGFALFYADDAIVHTPPRLSLESAVRQARRVAGGRVLLRQKGNAPSAASIAPHRDAVESVEWILSHPALGSIERVKVLCVAAVIKLASTVEKWRLRLGTAPERR